MALAGIVVVVLLLLTTRGCQRTPTVSSSPTPVSTGTFSSPEPTTPSAPRTLFPPSTPSTPPAPVGLPTRTGASTGTQLEDPIICRAVTNEGKPVDPTRHFQPRSTFFCSVQALNLKKGSELSAVWQKPDGESTTRRLTADKAGSFYVYFALSPPPSGWDIGKYKLHLLADGVLQQTLDFEVGHPGMTPASPAPTSHVVQAVVCKEVDARRRPLEEVTSFPPTVSAVRVAVQLHEVAGGKSVSTRWYKENQPVKEMTWVAPRSGSGWTDFKATWSPQWPVGAYKVEVYYDGALQRTVEFSVR